MGRPKKVQTDIPPHSEEAEQGVLGSMLIDPKGILPQATIKIEEEDFYIPANKTIYSRIKELYEKGKPVDLITLTNYLRDKEDLQAVGDIAYVTHLFTFVPSASNFNYYVEIVKDKSTLRKIIEKCRETITTAFENKDDVESVISQAQIEVGGIRRFNYVPPKTLADHIEEKMSRIENGEPNEDVIETRIKELDRLSPLRKGDFVIIKGEKKAGKSIFALSILENICIFNKLTGLYFSLEDRIPKVVDRIFSGASRIPGERHHIKKMTPEDITRAGEAVLKISASNIIIYDDVFDLSGIVARSKQAVLDHPDLAIIVIDYAQLARVVSKKSDSREREVATISRTLRLLSMETGVPIIVLSQVNKDGESRESRTLEQDCTACWKIDFDPDEEEEEKYQSKVRIIRIEFQRNGESGVFFPVRFLGHLARVENPAAEKLDFDKK